MTEIPPGDNTSPQPLSANSLTGASQAARRSARSPPADCHRLEPSDPPPPPPARGQLRHGTTPVCLHRQPVTPVESSDCLLHC